MQAQDTVLCPNCNSYILQKCQMIHNRVCLKRKQIKKQQKGFFANIFSSQKKKQTQQEDLIPCTQCGESYPFSVFAVHQQECVGHQLTKCHQCLILFPTFLFDQHLQVCMGPKLLPPPTKPIVNPPQINNLYFNKPLNNSNPVINKIPTVNVSSNQIMHQDQDDDNDNDNDEILNMMIGDLAKKQIQNNKLTQDPLNGQQMKKLQPVKLNSVEQCSICCCQMITKAKHIQLNCNHVFHKRCITSWLGKNPLCPMCRRHALKQ